MFRRLAALLTYPGGKRRLLPRIFKHLPSPAEMLLFVDLFLGGGAVSFWAKVLGYRVSCNDVAPRSAIVGRAIIQNDRVRLTEADILRLFIPHPQAGTFVQERFGGDVLTSKHAAFLDNARAASREAPEPKLALFQLLFMKYALHCRPMGNFGAKTIVRQMEAGDWEAMNPNYVRDALARTVYGHPKALVDVLRRQINRGVFANGHPNESHQMDAVEFLQKVQGDILYLDPPYPGTQAYETALRPLDEMLAGRPLNPVPSRFSRKDGRLALEALLDEAGHFPLWVISYGNRETTLEELVRLVKKFRPVQHAEAIRYVHCTGLAGKAHRERNRELLIVARSRK